MLTTASSPILIFRIAVVASSAAVKVLDVVISHLQAASAPPFRIVDVAVRHLTHQFAPQPLHLNPKRLDRVAHGCQLAVQPLALERLLAD